jgi:hypothetical protein
MQKIRRAAVIAVAAGLALTTGCGAASDTGTARSPAAATPAESAPPGATSLASGTAATGAAVQPTDGTAGTTAGAAPVRSADSEPVLTWTGLAGVRVGSHVPAFAAALRHRLSPLDATNRQTLAEHRCAYRELSGLPGLRLRVTGADAEGPVQVISLSQGSRIETSAGIALGDSLEEVRRAYGAFLLDEKFDFWPADGHALTAQATDGARWVFIADNKNQLVEIRLGFTPDVFAPEGCA